MRKRQRARSEVILPRSRSLAVSALADHPGEDRPCASRGRVVAPGTVARLGAARRVLPPRLSGEALLRERAVRLGLHAVDAVGRRRRAFLAGVAAPRALDGLRRVDVVGGTGMGDGDAVERRLLLLRAVLGLDFERLRYARTTQSDPGAQNDDGSSARGRLPSWVSRDVGCRRPPARDGGSHRSAMSVGHRFPQRRCQRTRRVIPSSRLRARPRFEDMRDLALVPPDRGPIGEASFTLRS